jgi:MscS family membrane protein
VEQVLGLTYSTKAGDMAAMVEEIRSLILAEPEVDPSSVLVYFRDFSASSLDIWVVYGVKDPDFPKSFALRERLNLAFMQAVERRGLSFAFPSQSIYLEGEVARALAHRGV